MSADLTLVHGASAASSHVYNTFSKLCSKYCGCQVSAIKYSLIQAFLQLGYHTLVSDMDLVYISNPFKHLHRCSAY
jgi:hypothetical protein